MNDSVKKVPVGNKLRAGLRHVRTVRLISGAAALGIYVWLQCFLPLLRNYSKLIQERVVPICLNTICL